MTEREAWELNVKIANMLRGRIDIEPYDEETMDGTIFFEDDGGPRWANWAQDTNAALELALSEDVIGIDINQAGGEVVALMRSDTRRATGYGDTYAEAICRAWLEYKNETRSE